MGAWDQRPLFKANVSKFAQLRQATPRIEEQLLRKITTLFPLPAELMALSPEYEPEIEPHDDEKERILV